MVKKQNISYPKGNKFQANLLGGKFNIGGLSYHKQIQSSSLFPSLVGSVKSNQQSSS
jgi:hypothetical protein